MSYCSKHTRRWSFDSAAKRRRESAEQRNAAWAKLTPAQKLAALDERLGVGVGATKQRLKLHVKLAEKPVTDKRIVTSGQPTAIKLDKPKKNKKNKKR